MRERIASGLIPNINFSPVTQTLCKGRI